MSEIAQQSGDLIVVGVDGSVDSKDALRWAGRQADLTGAALLAVTTWHLPTIAYGAGALAFPADFDPEQESRTALDAAIAEVLGDRHPGVKVSTLVVEGHPQLELLKAAEAAQLLVLGSRGHGAFAGMLLGSVSQHCVAHSTCPVVVVHYKRPAA
jgi:nucleotide-binding universal stress UspA family protein